MKDVIIILAILFIQLSSFVLLLYYSGQFSFDKKDYKYLKDIYFNKGGIESFGLKFSQLELQIIWKLIVRVSVFLYLLISVVSFYIMFNYEAWTINYSLIFKVLLCSFWLSIFPVMILSFILVRLFSIISLSRTLIYSVLIFCPMFVMFVFNAIYLLNKNLDSSVATSYRETVIDKKIKATSARDIYYVFLNGVYKDYIYKLEVNSDLYNCIDLGQTRNISVRDGYFGFKWVDYQEIKCEENNNE